MNKTAESSQTQTNRILIFTGVGWYARRDLIPRPLDSKSDALSLCLCCAISGLKITENSGIQ
ncbi:MAG: hypothetical protein ACXACF_11075, partial [Candidatus Hermodarchaeia archaeon]